VQGCLIQAKKRIRDAFCVAWELESDMEPLRTLTPSTHSRLGSAGAHKRVETPEEGPRAFPVNVEAIQLVP